MVKKKKPKRIPPAIYVVLWLRENTGPSIVQFEGGRAGDHSSGDRGLRPGESQRCFHRQSR